MSVYVDPRFNGGVWNCEGYMWCHMRADSKEELHAFAKKIGRKRCWYHRGDHYDLTPSFRAKAVAAGAIEVTPEELLELRKVWRAKYPPRERRGRR